MYRHSTGRMLSICLSSNERLLYQLDEDRINRRGRWQKQNQDFASEQAMLEYNSKKKLSYDLLERRGRGWLSKHDNNGARTTPVQKCHAIDKSRG